MRGFKPKGYIDIYVKEKDKILKEYHINNLFLINGRKLLLDRMGYLFRGKYAYIIISNSEVEPNINDIDIPGSIYSYSPQSGNPDPLFITENLTVSKRFHQQISAPEEGVIRNINTVGIAKTVGGTNAYCFCKLPSTIEQTHTIVLEVFYTISLSPYS